MDPVDEFAKLRAEIQVLEGRAAVLRDSFLRPGVRLRSNGYEVVVTNQRRRLFQKDRLPASVLNDPSYWLESVSKVVTVKALGMPVATMVRSKPTIKADDFDLIEPF